LVRLPGGNVGQWFRPASPAEPGLMRFTGQLATRVTHAFRPGVEPVGEVLRLVVVEVAVDPALVGGIALEQAVRDLLQGFSQLDLDW
jgi:hypothetical protein